MMEESATARVRAAQLRGRCLVSFEAMMEESATARVRAAQLRGRCLVSFEAMMEESAPVENWPTARKIEEPVLVLNSWRHAIPTTTRTSMSLGGPTATFNMSAKIPRMMSACHQLSWPLAGETCFRRYRGNF